MIKLLENYPFTDPGVRLAEGFAAHDGTLHDVPGKFHGGIDYVLKKGDEFASFEVYSMFEGDVKFGVSESWGKYFIISKQVGNVRVDVVYAHLDHIDENLQKYAIIQGDKDFVVPKNYYLGMASMTGDTKHIRRLHIELHEKDLPTGQHLKKDPYGIYDCAKSGKYPQPGVSLSNCNHAWTSDIPPLAKM